jgi:uncharacterized protein (TIGR03435 family)
MIGKIFVVSLLGVGMAMGQAASAPTSAATAAPVKTLAFDVVSIRQNTAGIGRQAGLPVFGPTADGYRMTNMQLMLPILTAYVPQTGGAAFFTNNQVTGLPDWVETERYDIDAKVADDDRAEWQKPAEQPAMLRAMLQALLVDRCKIVVHRDVKEVPVYSLVIGKNGPKFKETNPEEEHPGGINLPWGGTLVPSQDGMKLYGASMQSLATLLSQIGRMDSRPIQDKTGLTGKYDLTIKPPPGMGGPPSGPPQEGGASSAPDPGPSLSSIIADQLGLDLKPAKAPVESLVIDHIEKPSQN